MLVSVLGEVRGTGEDATGARLDVQRAARRRPQSVAYHLGLRGAFAGSSARERDVDVGLDVDAGLPHAASLPPTTYHLQGLRERKKRRTRQLIAGHRAPGESVLAACGRFITMPRGLLAARDPEQVEHLAAITRVITESPARLALARRVCRQTQQALGLLSDGLGSYGTRLSV